MNRYLFKLQKTSPFATPMAGDTLFGQLCWAIRHLFGSDKLDSCLENYVNDSPFLVVSDALPAGYLPMPCLPLDWLFDASMGSECKNQHKKKLKKFQWLPAVALNRSNDQWWNILEQETAIENSSMPSFVTESQARNSINRWTNTTSGAEFAPFTEPRNWFERESTFELYVVLDETRLSIDELQQLLEYVGLVGFGKNASIGNGRFLVVDRTSVTSLGHAEPNAFLTLAPSTPQGSFWQTEHCFYKTVVRFGRHGAEGVHMGSPFKAPVVFASSGAVLTPLEFDGKWIVGRGLGGDGALSKTLTKTVAQGYAPVAGLHLDIRQQPSVC